MQFADTHCHLDFPQFDGGREELLGKCTDASIELIVVPAVKKARWQALLVLADQFSQVRVALGLHPFAISEHQESHLNALEAKLIELGRAKLCGIGEIGLDATISDFDKQVFFFEQQLALAEQFDLPVIIHSRKTHSQVFKTLKQYCVPGGVVHAFSGSVEEAKAFVSVGMTIGVGGVITWSRASKTRNAISKLPLDSLVLETDAPDMPAFGQAKGEGTPLNILSVFHSLCQIRDESPETIAAALWENSQRLFSKKMK